MLNKKRNLLAGLILFIFGIIFSSISLVNHYNFRTYALDLGLYNNALYDYAHFRVNHYSLLQELFTNPLADHFSLITPLVSPLYWILGSYTLLVVQIAGILFGGYGIYIYFKNRTETKYLPEIAMLHFFCIWGIYSALSFDFHDNILAAMFVPWFFYFFDKEKWKQASIFFVLILITKENMAVWAIFICLGLILMYWKDKLKIRKAAFYMIIASVYFVTVVKVLMPFIQGDMGNPNGYYHFKYAALGNTFGEALNTIFTEPLYTLKLLFINNTGDPVADDIKKELHIMVLLSGGFALFLRPQFLVMLIPIYAQKLFSDDYGKWGLTGQYAIEFVPIISIALFLLILSAKDKRVQLLAGIVMVSVTAWATKDSLDNMVSKWYAPERHKFYTEAHYTRTFNVDKAYEALKLIPDDARVSAQSPLVPHLSFRETIYQFPVVENADYIILFNKEEPYPLMKEDLDKKIVELLSSPKWECIYKENFIWIFRRN